jgi:hypothetical protein
MHDEWAVERHIALLPMAREANALLFLALCWCPRLPVGRTNEEGYRTIGRIAKRSCNRLISPRGMGPKFAPASLFADTLHDRVIE